MREQILKLRNEGRSLIEISNLLGKSKSTIQYHFNKNNIKPFSKDFTNQSRQKGSLTRKANSLQKCLVWQEEGWKMGDWNNAELALLAALYWGEGSKTERAVVRLTNMDPFLLKQFVYLLKKYFKVIDSDLSLWVQYHTELIIEDCIDFWKKELEIPNVKVLKPYKKKNSTVRLNKSKFGICRIGITNIELFCKICGLIKFYGRIDDKMKWLTIAG